MTLNDFVDKIYCINLDRRPDRMKRSEEVFKQHHLVVERVAAVDGKTLSGGSLPLGALGVVMSNLGILRGAKASGLKSICIFEDDIELSDQFEENFRDYIVQVPKDWAFLYLGASNKKPTLPVAPNIRKLTKAYGAYAVIINSNIYDVIIDNLSKENLQLDFVYARMHSKYPSYVMSPYLAWVRNDYSDINERYIDVSRLKNPYIL